MTFGKRFKELRLRKGLTQQQVADRFHTDKSSISRYENDQQIPNEIGAYADFFDVSVDYLLSGKKQAEKVIPKDTFITKLLKQCIEEGIITDPDNIDESTKDLILNAVKIELKRIKEDI